MIIEDGRGTGSKARVDANNLIHVHAITEGTPLHAADQGDAYNINTGVISFSAAGSLIYIKNNEDQDLIIESIVVGLGTATMSDSARITVTKNDDAGDLITDATAMTINQNRDFGSSQTLLADVYKGKSGGTATGGDDVVLFFASGSSRLFASINLIVPKGSSISLMLDPQLSSGSVSAYGAITCYLKDPIS